MVRRQGKTIAGKYTLLRLLGEGGFARVYLGLELLTKKKVAIKLLRESLSLDPCFVRRMEREALAIRKVSHPNSVRLLELGRDRVGVYLVMESLEGDSLWDRLCEQRPLSPEEAVPYLLGILSALSLCHAKGIVHRDIKPDNIMLCPEGEKKVAKLLDFGIAHLKEAPQVTRPGQMVGTPAYMSPEQICAKGVGPASDLYSLGVILYELLTGRPPFEGSNPLELCRKHLKAPPPSLEEACPASPELLPFEPVLQKALQKSPRDRFASALAFGEALLFALLKSQKVRASLQALATRPGAQKRARQAEEPKEILSKPPKTLLSETLLEEDGENTQVSDTQVSEPPKTLLSETLFEETQVSETLLSETLLEEDEENTQVSEVTVFGEAKTVVLAPKKAQPTLPLLEEAIAEEDQKTSHSSSVWEEAYLPEVKRVSATSRRLPLLLPLSTRALDKEEIPSPKPKPRVKRRLLSLWQKAIRGGKLLWRKLFSSKDPLLCSR